MTTDREKLLSKVAKVLNMASGAKALGNIEESAAFAAKAQEMLIRHGLDMTEIEAFNQQDADPMNEEDVNPETYGGKRYAKPLKWQVVLAQSIAEAYGGVSFYWSRSNTMTFVGRNSTRPVMVYVYATLARVGPRLMMKARRDARSEGIHETGFEGSYMIGFARAISERLEKERRDLETRIHNEAKAAHGDTGKVSTALTRIRNQPDEARVWYQRKHFPPAPPLSEEEKARREKEANARAERQRLALKNETPEAKKKREKEEAQAEKRYRQWQEKQSRKSEWASRDVTIDEAVERGYKDGKEIQINKGLDEGAKRDRHLKLED